MNVAIIDYKAGNLTSVKNALAALGVSACVTSDPTCCAQADRIIFPGVGAAKSAMAHLQELHLIDTLRTCATSGKPFLGICLGMQILFERTEEDGGVDLLGVLPGEVKRFPHVKGCKVPQIGWNQVNGKAEFYFVHSYYAPIIPWTVGTTEYAGVTFTSQVRKGALWACQFHPEKSGRVGLELLKEFLSC